MSRRSPRRSTRTTAFPRSWSRCSATWACCSSGCRRSTADRARDLTSVCIVKEEIAKVSESAALLAANNSFGLILPILNFGTEEQKRHYLGIAAKGRTLTSVAITEAGTGSDVSSMKTRAVKDGASWVLNGGKIYITFGSVAHYILVFARTSEGKGANGISAFIVDTKTPGFSFGKEDRKMGIRGVPNVPIFFDNLRVPGGEHDRARGPGLQDLHAHPRPQPADHRRDLGRAGAGRDRPGGLLWPRTQAVRPADRRVPGHPVHAGRHADADRGGALPALRLRAHGRPRGLGRLLGQGVDGEMLSPATSP